MTAAHHTHTTQPGARAYVQAQARSRGVGNIRPAKPHHQLRSPSQPHLCHVPYLPSSLVNRVGCPTTDMVFGGTPGSVSSVHVSGSRGRMKVRLRNQRLVAALTRACAHAPQEVNEHTAQGITPLERRRGGGTSSHPHSSPTQAHMHTPTTPSSPPPPPAGLAANKAHTQTHLCCRTKTPGCSSCSRSHQTLQTPGQTPAWSGPSGRWAWCPIWG